MKHDVSYYLYNLVTPLDVITGVMMIIYVALAARADRKRTALFWCGALIATVIGAYAMDKTEKAMDVAEHNIDVPWPHLSFWFLALAGVMIIPPLVNLVRAIFSGELYQMALWATMFGAASTVFAQSGLYRYFADGWGLGASLSQFLFVGTGVTLLGFTVQELIWWRREAKARHTLQNFV